MNSLKKQLIQIGLTEKEAKIYLAALELGETSIERIAQKANIKRTTIYGLLDNLKEKGLISVSKRKSKNIYFAQDPHKLEANFKQKAKILEDALPQLTALANLIDNKPKISFYEGKEEVKKIYNDVLNYPNQELTFWGSQQSFYQTDPSFWTDYYIPQRIKNKIWTRVVAPDSKEGREMKSKDSEELRKTKISKKDFIKAEVLLYANGKISVISFEEMIGFIIESKKLYTTLKGLFEVHWESLGE